MALQSSRHVVEVDVIADIVGAITKSFDLDEVGQSIVDSIVKYLGSPGGTLLLTDDKRQVLFAHSTSNTPMIRKILTMLKKSFRKHTFSYTKEPLTLLGRTVREQSSLQSDRFEDFLSPEIPKFLARLIQKFARVKRSISLPVVIGKKVLGVLFISFYEDQISAERMSILSVFANHAAIAINNAAKYEELQQRYHELNQRFDLEKEMISILSHELKTPIAIAVNTAQNMEYALEDLKSKSKISWKEVRVLNKNILEALNRLNQITNSVMILREVETQGASLIHELDLKNQLSPLIETFARAAKKKGLTLSYRFDLKQGTFYGGGVQFEQLVSILLDNAIKYTDSGSIELFIQATDQKLSCIVTDTGPGIPYNERKSIFRRFYRHRLQHKKTPGVSGLGLGLYIAKKIVEHLDGTIKMTSSPGRKGSRFVAEIPVYQKKSH